MDRICDRIEEYQEGQLTREKRLEFENHLESCPSCREELAWIRSLDRMFEKAPARKPPRGLERAVFSALGFGRRPVWAATVGWAAAGLVGAWIIALPILVRTVGHRSIVPAARSLAGLPSIITTLLNGLRVFVDLLKPAGVTTEALIKTATHTNLPLITLLILVIGFAAGLGLWRNLREVSYVRIHT